MNPTEKLLELFLKFPGIGQKQAKRFVFFLLSQNPVYIKELSTEILNLKKSAKKCDMCFRFFFDHSQNNICSICRSNDRENAIMIVSRDLDVENIEKSGEFRGKYFVLGGTIPILEKEPSKKIRISSLLTYLEKLAKEESADWRIKEVILATDFNPEGENTADFVRREISPLAKKYGFEVHSLGKGLSLGTELEYSDPETIKNALKNRV